MLLFTYGVLIVSAALPLVGTLLTARSGQSSIAFLHRLYRDLAYIVVAILGIMCFETALTISLQDYWFDELAQRYRYWLALGLRSGIFVTAFVSVGIFVGLNLRTLCRPLPVMPRSAPWVAAFIFSAVVAFSATALWTPLLGFLGATPTGTDDPVFGKDVAFYLLALPWYDAVVGIVMTVLVITFGLWAFIGLGLYPRAGKPWDHLTSRLRPRGERSLIVIDSVEAASQTTSGLIWEQWLRQALLLGALLCLASGVSRYLGRYHLVIEGHSQVVAGGSYADVLF
jgi:uncharacterized membrane protein (UPF0182 family)